MKTDLRQRKRKILSVRLTDSELGELHRLMADQQLTASDLLREALLNFSSQPRLRGATPVTARAA